MTRRIHVLPDHLANQIAAGEVVDRPASVVKELVENALDAGADRIDVAVRNGGKTEIRVADNGVGMGREDALLSLDRHATSKLRRAEDLSALRTLGFRGEALPSVASVSRLTLETAEEEGDGTRVVVTGGQIGGVEPCARRAGTTVTVRNLFFNVPARAKFLRSAAAETRAISDVVVTLSLAHPAVTFSLESNGRALLDLGSAEDVRARVGEIWDAETAEELIPVAFREEEVLLSGFVQRPHSATPGGRRAYLYVNGRAFSERALLRAADRGYRTTIAPGVHPSVFLFLEVPDGAVDVNVHPTKAEVHFRDPGRIEQVVEDGIRNALAALVSAPAIGERPGGEAESPAYAPSGRPHTRVAREPGGEAGGEASSPEAQMSLFVAGREEPSASGIAPDEARPLPLAGPSMWQVHNSYIMAETRSGLIIVDQHSAHERVLYEEMMRGFGSGKVAGQRLLFPFTLRLSPPEHSLVEEVSGILTQAGFEIESFGSRAVIVHAAPNPHPYFDAEKCLREMIDELTQGSELVGAARNQHQRIALSYACKAAIKAGQRLSPAEMTELFDRLFATELPYHDIHGRPTVLQLSLAELHHRFGRHG